MSLRFKTLHYRTLITLHYTPVHYITLHYTPVHSTTLNYTTPHYITLSVAAWKKNTLRRHREGDMSEGCARFRHAFVVCCVNTVGAVEVSI